MMERWFITAILHDKEFNDDDDDNKTATMMLMRMLMLVMRMLMVMLVMLMLMMFIFLCGCEGIHRSQDLGRSTSRLYASPQQRMLNTVTTGDKPRNNG